MHGGDLLRGERSILQNALLLTGGLLVYMDSDTSSLVEVIGKGRAVLNIPNQLFVLLAVAIVVAFVLNKTSSGAA